MKSLLLLVFGMLLAVYILVLASAHHVAVHGSTEFIA